ncbi:hypothetical protein [Flavobacterium sp.]|jgi:hypothetical protein|uniref:hypothetical protein n=1 Tax=Flavobacterium sp. TaxID=239 RepID=UPI002A828BF3|nr:hypothetical protein [Flavobacterium sp.]
MFNKKYELVKIKNINYKHEAYKNFSNIGLNLSELISLYINIIGFGSGDILFKYGYQTISFFHGLNIIEKGKVVNEINLKLSLKNKKA